MQGYHESVLLKEAVGALCPAGGGINIRDAWYLDCTLGDGGHTKQIIKRDWKVVAIDVDPLALKRVRKRFKDEGINSSRFRLIRGNFRDIKQMDIAEIKFAGAIFDLGVSSLQLMSPERGFSFALKGPLDMRMDPGLAVQAMDLVNNLSGKELYELFKNLGEEKYSKRVAEFVVRAREIKTTTELADLIERVVGKKEKIHPATRVFQALRIAVNDELNALREGLEEVKDLIQKNGRIVVISFHSLEDRIVKNTFRQWKLEGLGKILTKKPVLPTETEVAVNPRARSAKMRVFEII